MYHALLPFLFTDFMPVVHSDEIVKVGLDVIAAVAVLKRSASHG